MKSNQQYNVDNYYSRLKESKDSETTVKIYCDASFKDNIMVSGIKVYKDGDIEKITKQVNFNNVEKAEVYAIEMALDYLKDNFIKQAIIYTEINSIIQAFIYIIVLNMKYDDLTNKELKYKYNQYYIMWQKFKGQFRRCPYLFLCKIESDKNPSHEVVCNKRNQLLQENQKEDASNFKKKVQIKIISICEWIISKVRKWNC